MDFKRLLFTTAASLVGGLLVTPAPTAQAYGSPGCVSRSEFLWARAGLTQPRIHKVFESAGQYTSTTAEGGWRLYRTCTPGYWAQLSYVDGLASGRRYWGQQTPTCATISEWNRARDRHLRMFEVHAIFQTAGVEISREMIGNSTVVSRRYRRCASSAPFRLWYEQATPTAPWIALNTTE